MCPQEDDPSISFFTCIKCGDEIEYTEFSEAPDPKMDYGYYVCEGWIEPFGVQIVKGVDLCSMCCKVINVGA
jgi:hypothetical protein